MNNLQKSKGQLLPKNFHYTFKPERIYISAMLRFANSGGSGNFQEISKATGIPTGKSSGKVQAILDYCRGMGLISLSESENPSTKKPILTAFGEMVFSEDPFLKTEVTQWIAHMNLCSPSCGALVWVQTFHDGSTILGNPFPRSRLENYLRTTLQAPKGNIIGPLISTYEDEAAFKTCGALRETKGLVYKKPAPISREICFGLSCWMVQQISNYFPGVLQISFTDLDFSTGLTKVAGWNSETTIRFLDTCQSLGFIEIDKHMSPILLIPLLGTAEAWKRIYDGLS